MTVCWFACFLIAWLTLQEFLTSYAFFQHLKLRQINRKNSKVWVFSNKMDSGPACHFPCGSLGILAKQLVLWFPHCAGYLTPGLSPLSQPSQTPHHIENHSLPASLHGPGSWVTILVQILAQDTALTPFLFCFSLFTWDSLHAYEADRKNSVGVCN